MHEREARYLRSLGELWEVRILPWNHITLLHNPHASVSIHSSFSLAPLDNMSSQLSLLASSLQDTHLPSLFYTAAPSLYVHYRV